MTGRSKLKQQNSSVLNVNLMTSKLVTKNRDLRFGGYSKVKVLTYIVKDGYEIKKVDDKTIRKFDLELLKEKLRFHYMGEGEIQRVIQNSKDFVVQEGIIRIRQLRSDSTN